MAAIVGKVLRLKKKANDNLTKNRNKAR